jgi:hypothetical protein
MALRHYRGYRRVPCDRREGLMPRSPKNLTAARALARSVHEPDAATYALVVLAQTLAREVDAAAGGAQPGYVLAKLAATYSDLLRALSAVVSTAPDDAIDRLLAEIVAGT